MLQKYVGTKAKEDAKAISWILDDDMRIDSRALNYLPWLPIFKENKIDILIGSFDGSTPNTPLNGLRVLLVDLYHNILWLQSLDSEELLPNRSEENIQQRIKYPDYYYDLSRKHSGHLEAPHWIEPEHKGETVSEAYMRLLTNAPLIITGHPLTRPIRSKEFTATPLDYAKPSVNRGGNTFILNADALLDTPNLSIQINGRGTRRSDMIWAIINKYANKMDIRSVPFPVLHDGRVSPKKRLDIPKVIDEIIGSTIYGALCDFLRGKENHSLKFTEAERNEIWNLVIKFRDIRLNNLYISYMRIIGLTKTIDGICGDEKLDSLLNYLKQSFSIDKYMEVKNGVLQMKSVDVHKFLSSIYSDSFLYARSSKKQKNQIDD